MGNLRLRAVIHPSFQVIQTAESPTFQFTPSDSGVKAWCFGIIPLGYSWLPLQGSLMARSWELMFSPGRSVTVMYASWSLGLFFLC